MQTKPSTRPLLRRALSRAALVALLCGGTALATHELIPAGHAEPAAGAAPIKPVGPSERLPDFSHLVKQVKPAVVSITSKMPEPDEGDQGGGGGGFGGQQFGGGGQGFPFPFPFPFQMQPRGGAPQMVEARGSGFIVSADGTVITNNHVVKGATSIKVTLDDGTVLPAKVVGRDPGTDLAVLKVSSKTPLPFVELGESDDVEPGQWVVAIGNPFGLGGTVTAGIVSARGRDIGDGPYSSFLQIDAPINRGNSGGPLLTQDGKVIGVNTAILSPSGGSIGIGFAIPSDTVRNVEEQILKTGHVVHGYLGVLAQPVSPGIASALGLPKPATGAASGALVASVTNDSPAQKVGVKPGDVITEVQGKKIDTPHDLQVAVGSVKPGNTLALTVIRDGKTLNLSPVIGNLADADKDKGSAGVGGSTAGGKSLGVSLTELSPQLRQQLGLSGSVHGAVVRGVTPGSPADQAGIGAGDVIVGVNNKSVNDPSEAVAAVHAALKGSGTVALRVLHQGQMAFIAITPGDAGGNAGSDGGGSDDDQNG